MQLFCPNARQYILYNQRQKWLDNLYRGREAFRTVGGNAGGDGGWIRDFDILKFLRKAYNGISFGTRKARAHREKERSGFFLLWKACAIFRYCKWKRDLVS